MGPIGRTSARLAAADADTALMIAVRDGEIGAFEQLVKRYQHRLVGVLWHLQGSLEEAEDLAQEVFLRVYRTRRRYRARAKFSTWLFTIANHLAANARRDRRRRPQVRLPSADSRVQAARPAAELIPDPATPPPLRIQERELARLVRRAVDRLSDRQRIAVVLHKFEGMNYREIGEVMGLSTKAVKSLLNRARTNLRQELAEYIFMDNAPAGLPLPPE